MNLYHLNLSCGAVHVLYEAVEHGLAAITRANRQELQKLSHELDIGNMLHEYHQVANGCGHSFLRHLHTIRNITSHSSAMTASRWHTHTLYLKQGWAQDLLQEPVPH